MSKKTTRKYGRGIVWCPGWSHKISDGIWMGMWLRRATTKDIKIGSEKWNSGSYEEESNGLW